MDRDGLDPGYGGWQSLPGSLLERCMRPPYSQRYQGRYTVWYKAPRPAHTHTRQVSCKLDESTRRIQTYARHHSSTTGIVQEPYFLRTARLLLVRVIVVYPVRTNQAQSSLDGFCELLKALLMLAIVLGRLIAGTY